MPALELEELWEDVLAFIEEGRVIPIIGSELLTIEENGQAVSIYRAVGERILKRYGLTATLRRHNEVSDAVSAVAATGKRMRDLYRPVCDILQRLIAEHPDSFSELQDLASISDFDIL